MKKSVLPFLAAILACGCLHAQATTRYVSPFGGHVAPFTDWSTAATNIQAAIDSSSAGDLVLVTNGVYSTGGKAMAGTLTNRVTLDKVVTVQSLNGPAVTTIIGRTAFSAPLVRCVWLTNGATLSGFTLLYGATQSSGDTFTLQVGGGVWCASPSAVVTNCIVYGNVAWMGGGSAYRGTLKNCLLEGSVVEGGSAIGGGGAYGSILNNCLVYGNQANSGSGATYSCVLSNCTVVYNYGGSSGGSSHDSLYNSIVYFNSTTSGFSYQNYDFTTTLQYCCTSPRPSFGAGNITSDPQLTDGVHISSVSPCRGVGSAAYSRGVDLDGQTWATPPSIGCDEWHAEPAIAAWTWILPGTRVGEAALSARLVGQQPVTCYWTKDGQPIEDGPHYTNSHKATLLVRQFGVSDGGVYQLTVSNSFGMTASQVKQPSVHCVDTASAAPALPFTNWLSAATNIQDAVDSATAWDVVLVTNGIYAFGGAMDGTRMNRVVLGLKLGILVMSLNGPDITVIEGQRASSASNAPPPMRCVYGFDGAISGFTLRDGEVTNIPPYTGASGGGIYGGVAAFCVLSNNASGQYGGGSFDCALSDCLVTANSAATGGGGCFGGSLNDCTVTLNSAPAPGTGAYLNSLTNCIVYFNVDSVTGSTATNYISSSMQNCCSTPLPPGVGNISSDPHLVDARHIAASSPCAGAGSATNAVGSDLDGQAWANPPSIGCDEVATNDFSGPLAVGVTAAWNEVAVGRQMPLAGQIEGRAAEMSWSFGDGPTLSNASYLVWHAWTNPGDYVVTFTAFNNDNPSGVSTNLVVHVVPLVAPLLSPDNWSSTNFGLQFPGQAGVVYVVEKATNLIQPVVWQAVQTLLSTGGVAQVYDNPGANAALFYRARTQ